MPVVLSRLTIIIIVAGFACIVVILGVTLGVLLHPCRIVTNPTNVTITADHGKFLHFAWLNPEENGDCSVSYSLLFRINGEKAMEVTTSEPHCTLILEDICFDLAGNLWTVGKFGRKSDHFTWLLPSPYPVDPANIPALNDLSFTKNGEDVTLSWTTPKELQNCYILYSIKVTSDNLGEQEFFTYDEYYTISRTQYCFSMNVSVAAIIGDSVGPAYERQYTESLNSPNNYKMEFFPSDNLLKISWARDPLHYQCNLEYKVTYRLRNSEEKVYTMQDPTITFPLAYCTSAVIVFYTIGPNIQSPGYYWSTIEDLPLKVEPVRNFTVDFVSGNEAHVLWDSPEFVEACTDIVYTVTATNDNITTPATCTGKSECVVQLDDFCPFTNFTVQATSTKGEMYWEIYECPFENED